MATGTAPAQWLAEPDEVLATVIDVLEDQAEQLKSKRRKGK